MRFRVAWAGMLVYQSGHIVHGVLLGESVQFYMLVYQSGHIVHGVLLGESVQFYMCLIKHEAVHDWGFIPSEVFFSCSTTGFWGFAL